MTDRELLEAAAKAINGGRWHPLTHATPNGTWNPLQDDGDALRLAVKLYLWESIRMAHREMSNDVDIYAATRRAIVRAAAAMGKKL